jgi:hypothetical protein
MNSSAIESGKNFAESTSKFISSTPIYTYSVERLTIQIDRFCGAVSSHVWPPPRSSYMMSLLERCM